MLMQRALAGWRSTVCPTVCRAKLCESALNKERLLSMLLIMMFAKVCTVHCNAGRVFAFGVTFQDSFR
jgi:hypothetical protein